MRNSSIEQAKVGGKTSMQTFIDRQALWKAGGGMEMEVKEQTAASYELPHLAVVVAAVAPSARGDGPEPLQASSAVYPNSRQGPH